MKRPIISPKKESVDVFLEFASFTMLGAIWLLTAFQYAKLPDIIPVHFNASGEADGWGDKAILWILPLLTLVLTFLMKLLAGKPHLHNYPVKITEDNAEERYLRSARILRIAMLWMNVIFFFIMTLVLRSAVSTFENSGMTVLVVILTSTVGFVVFSVYNTYKK